MNSHAGAGCLSALERRYSFTIFPDGGVLGPTDTPRAGVFFAISAYDWPFLVGVLGALLAFLPLEQGGRPASDWATAANSFAIERVNR